MSDEALTASKAEVTVRKGEGRPGPGQGELQCRYAGPATVHGPTTAGPSGMQAAPASSAGVRCALLHRYPMSAHFQSEGSVESGKHM